MKTLSIREMRGALSRIDRILEEESEIIGVLAASVHDGR